LVDYVTARAGHRHIDGPARADYNPVKPERRVSQKVGVVGDGQVPVVVGPVAAGADLDATGMLTLQALEVAGNEALLADLHEHPERILRITADSSNPVGSWRSALFALMEAGCLNPVILSHRYEDQTLDAVQLKAAADFGVMLLDQLVDGIEIVAPALTDEARVGTALAILQAARQRFTRTEYIACPSCGRTLFDLTSTLAEIKAATAHLKGLKIGIMGCIVNGPGEMADADYGYVGAGPGRVSLYKGKTCIERGIPAAEAVSRLLQFIEEDQKNQ
jgi:(E)-4-hydroxy-3-methylbut-2-enyl-diphosphate synthase